MFKDPASCLGHEVAPIKSTIFLAAAAKLAELLECEQVRAHNEQGGFVLPDVFSAAEVADLLSELDPFEAERNADCRALIRTSQRSPDLMKVFRAHAVLVLPRLVSWRAIRLCKSWCVI